MRANYGKALGRPNNKSGTREKCKREGARIRGILFLGEKRTPMARLKVRLKPGA